MVAVTEFPEFPDLDKVTSFLKSSRGLGAEEGEKLLGNVGKWIESDIKVSVATKKGYYVEHMAEAGATRLYRRVV